jgi:hypothetical protein
MLMSTTRLVQRLKGVAVKVGTEGVRLVVDGTVTAVKVMDRLQELLADREQGMRVTREPARSVGLPRMEEQEPVLERPRAAHPVRPRRPAKEPSPEALATAELVLAEVEAVRERIKEARPARRPLKVRADVELPEDTPKRRKTTRTVGRKTTAASASPRRVTAKGVTVKGVTVKEGFKAKRGQKLRH